MLELRSQGMATSVLSIKRRTWAGSASLQRWSAATIEAPAPPLPTRNNKEAVPNSAPLARTPSNDGPRRPQAAHGVGHSRLRRGGRDGRRRLPQVPLSRCLVPVRQQSPGDRCGGGQRSARRLPGRHQQHEARVRLGRGDRIHRRD